MKPSDITIGEILKRRRKSWIRLFKMENYPQISQKIKKISQKHGDQHLMKDATVDFLKEQVDSSHAHAYIDVMQADLKYKITKDHLRQEDKN